MADKHSKKIEIFLEGGLGNQLFGYAAALALSRRLRCEFKLNVCQLSNRPLAIPKNALKGIQVSDTTPRYLKLKNNLAKKIYRNLPLTSSYFEKKFYYEKRFERLKNPVRLYGYFQSKNYFADFFSEIFDLLNVENTSYAYNRVRASLPHKFIAIHFRRGDYMVNSEFHPLATPDYYYAAILYLKSAGIDSEKVIFTDDEFLAREVFPENRIITQSDLIEPFDNMYLMSQGEAIIGANSSFSLWAAFLLDFKGGTCIFPKHWFGLASMEKLSPVPPEFIQI